MRRVMHYKYIISSGGQNPHALANGNDFPNRLK